MKRKWLLGLASVLLWLMGQSHLVQGTDPTHFRSLNLIRLSKVPTLPELSLPDVEGKVVSFSSFRGKVVLLNFWTTW